MISDPVLSQERIDASPEPYRALFRDYDTSLVIAALSMAGINDDPAKFTAQQISEGTQIARRLLEVEMQRRERVKTHGG